MFIEDAQSFKVQDESTVWVPRGAHMGMSEIADFSIPWIGNAIAQG